MKTLRVGVLAPLTGQSSAMGIGFRDSIQFILSYKSYQLSDKLIEVEILITDYKSECSYANNAVADLIRQDVIALIGPCDSACAYEILNSRSMNGCPLISPLTTATNLTKLGATNFFRMTTPDRSRAEMLIDRLAAIYPGATPYIWTQAGPPMCYSQGLKQDVIACLAKHKMTWKEEDFSVGVLPKMLPQSSEPILCCCSSSETARVIAALRNRGLRSQVFSFGSNTNLLIPELKDSIVVADLDRLESDSQIREEIRKFEVKYGNKSDPSIATMNCFALIMNLITRHSQQVQDMTPDEIRAFLTAKLKSEPQEGMFRNYMFMPNGEMAGNEHISLLTVRSSSGRQEFTHITDKTTDRARGPTAELIRIGVSKIRSRIRNSMIHPTGATVIGGLILALLLYLISKVLPHEIDPPQAASPINASSSSGPSH